MKKIIFTIVLLLILCSTSHALTYDADNFIRNLSYATAQDTSTNPIYLFMDEVEGQLAGEDGAASILLTPGTAPTATEGAVYYDAVGDVLKFRNASTWVTLASSGSATLDEAYDAGTGITVDAGAITLTTSAASDSAAFAIVHGETGNYAGMTLTNASAYPGIQITSSSTGADITGTSATWSISKAGAITCVGVDTTSTITLANDETILNDTNNEIQFGNGTEDISLGFATSDTLTLTTDTGVATINFGDLDAFTGVASITGDAGADFALATTNTGTYNFTIAQSGVGDNELRLTSAGTAANAIALTSSTGGITATAATSITASAAAGAIGIAATGGDITIDSTNKSVIIRGTEEAGDAIVIDADGTAGGIDVAFGTGNLAITGTGVSADFTVDGDLFSIDGTGTSNVTVTSNAGSEDFTVALAGATDSSLILSSTGTAEDALQITTTAGGINITNGGAAAGEDIDVVSTNASINLTAGESAVDSIVLSSTIGGIQITAAGGAATEDIAIAATSSSVIVSAGEDIADAIYLHASTGGIDILADGAAAKDLDLTCTNGSVHVIGGEAIADAITLASTGGVDITSAATFDIDLTATGGTVQISATEAAANQFKVDATGTIADASGDAIVLETTNGGILLNADNADNGDIGLEAGDDLRLTATGDMILTIGGHARVVDDDIVSFGTTDNVTMAYDEDGDNNLQIIGPVDFETTYHEFRSNGVSAQNDGTITGVATGETNIFVTEGRVFEWFVLGAGQTIVVPTLTADGLNIMQDEANDEGAEWTRGITSRSPDAYTVETDVFYFKVKFKIETVAELDICTAGFRIAGAYNADMYAYNTYVGLNVNNGTINEVEELNGANAAEVDTGEAWADGETHELETRIAADGTTTWFVDGTAITNQDTTCVFDWTDTDVVIPFFHFLQDDGNGCELELITWETGIYTQ